MKILHVYKDYDPPVNGGIERHIALMCRYQSHWSEVAALTCSRSLRAREVERDGIPVTEVGEWGRIASAPVSPLFPWHLRRANADVVVVHMPNPTAEVSWLLARPRGVLVVRYHSDVVRQAAAMRFYKPLMLNFLEHAGLVLPTSQQYLDSSPYLRMVKARCRVVPLGIVTEDFDSPEPEQVAALRARYGEKFVLFCGRHRYYKGLPYLIRAAEAIDATVVVAGSGPERGDAISLAAHGNGRVEFPGRLSQQELVNHLHACAVFVFPSVLRSEAFGLSILEAHACGKPVVATRLGTGVEYANQDGVTGYNVPPRDPAALAEAVNELLHNEETRVRMGERARERVRKDFHAARVARDEYQLYERVLECTNTRF